MKLCIHRGTHQIGGIAAEISTASTRILIDMGDELSLDLNFVSAPLNIPGVTDGNGHCDAVLFTHYHGDHTGQMLRIRPEIPIYAGALAKDIMRLSAERGGQKNEALCKRIETIQAFSPGKPFLIGDIQITPFCIDHSACDSYLFLTDSDGNVIRNPRHYRRMMAHLKKFQRRQGKRLSRAKERMGMKQTDHMSRKQLRELGNYQKASLDVRKAQQKVRRQRKDFLDKLSFQYIKNHDTVACQALLPPLRCGLREFATIQLLNADVHGLRYFYCLICVNFCSILFAL